MTDSTKTANDAHKKASKKVGCQRNHYTTVNMAPCRVCGGKSTGYHFGVVSCEACKAFFRRAIAKESYSKYVCQKGDDCANQPRRINSCCACRLRRCVEAGMSKNGVRRGRYSIELRTKSILDAQKIENERLNFVSKSFYESSQSVSTNKNIPSKRHGVTVTGSHETHLSSKYSMARNSNNLSVSEGQLRSLDIKYGKMSDQKECMKELSEGYPFCKGSSCVNKRGGEMLEYVQHSPDSVSGSSSSCDFLQNLNVMTEPYVGEQHPINFMVSIDEKEQMEAMIQTLINLQGALYPHHKVTEDILQKQKIIEREHQQREEAFLFMFGTTEYASSNDFKEVLSEVNIELDDRLTRFREKAHATETSIVNYVYYSKFVPGFKQLDKDDVSQLLKASYSEFWLFSNYATINEGTGVAGGTDVVLNGHKKVIKTFFPKDYVDDVFAFAQTLQRLDLNLVEVSLIRVIILTLTDRCCLKEPAKVEKLNQMFIKCLRHQLSKNTSDPGRRFYRIIDRLIAIRTLTHKNGHTNEQFLKEWGFLMNDFPLWREMMTPR